jgi:hypothetical protein
MPFTYLKYHLAQGQLSGHQDVQPLVRRNEELDGRREDQQQVYQVRAGRPDQGCTDFYFIYYAKTGENKPNFH